MKKLQYVILFAITGSLLWFSLHYLDNHSAKRTRQLEKDSSEYWYAPRLSAVSDSVLLAELSYGKELIEHTSKYFGPKGSIKPISNGMNCQNCHLESGTKIWGNNYGNVFAQYPKFRARSGRKENIPGRVNDCFERSLNGEALDTTSREMKAIVAYISWLGKDMAKGSHAKGAGITHLAYLDRAAGVKKGNAVYVEKCKSCHGLNGEGLMNADGTEFMYPPLWGEFSYNQRAGLFRLSTLAGFVKSNMPNGASFAFPLLSDEEAWDVAAYINSQPRPDKLFDHDWPDIRKKPVDHPFGPFADSFSELQHKLGPFKPILNSNQYSNK